MDLPLWILLVSGLLALAVVLGVLAKHVRLPLTVVLAGMGFLVGWAGEPLGLVSPLRGAAFGEAVTYLFLPVLVFEAALGLSTRAFFRNLGPILALAVPALAISATAVGVALHHALQVPILAALLFGVLISATDPVAVVSIFRQLGVPRRLLTLVEGESLLNDGVAIVLYQILLAAALGASVSPVTGGLDFLRVFFGGLAIGTLVGVVAMLIVPWLSRLAAAALTVAVAYGGFVLAEAILGFSGVTATVAAGLVMTGLERSRAPAPVREIWHELWESLGYVANGILFLLIGMAIEPRLLAEHPEAILLTIAVVLLARAAGVVPLVAVMERITSIPPVGMRNQVVLIWGGLRGGIALALALALPEELPQRDLFIALAGGVVLATLLLNATTIGPLVRRLQLDRPSRTDRFLAGSARLSGLAAARTRLAELELEEPEIVQVLERAERRTVDELARTPLEPEEVFTVVTGRGLVVERESYQLLADAGLLPSTAAHTLLDEVDDQIEEFSLDRTPPPDARRRERPVFDRLLERLSAALPGPLGDDATEIAYAEASARRLAARRTGDALELMQRLPNISPDAVTRAKETFHRWEREAIDSLAELDASARRDHPELHRRQAEALSRITSEEALAELVRIGLIPESAARRAREAIAEELGEEPPPEPEELDAGG
jgi:monovalent cation:H+ antiporter, CPA1 family